MARSHAPPAHPICAPRLARALRNAVLVAGLAGLNGGCVTWRDTVTRQAAFDHSCREDQVRVLRRSEDPGSLTVDLDVCGKVRRYRDLGGRRAYAWMDVTSAFPPEVLPSAGQAAVAERGGPLPEPPPGFTAARLARGAELRAGPDDSAAALAILPAGTVLLQASGSATHGFFRVRTATGREGFVKQEALSRP